MKFNTNLFNPFDYVNPEKIKNRVNTIKDRHPEWEKEDICKELVRQKSRLCGTTGALSALPSSLPGIGTVITLAGGTAVDITTMVYFLSELILEIATVYNREPSTEATSKEAFWVLSSCFGVEAATVGVSKVAVINASKKALSVLIEKLLSIIGGWLAKGILLRMIPLVGSIVNASINISACKQVGKEGVLWYKTNPEQDSMWNAGKEKTEEFWDEEDGEKTEETAEDLPEENIILEPMNEVKDEELQEEETEIIPPEENEIEIEDILHEEDIIELPEEDIKIEDISTEDVSVKEEISPEKEVSREEVLSEEEVFMKEKISPEEKVFSEEEEDDGMEEETDETEEESKVEKKVEELKHGREETIEFKTFKKKKKK